MTHDAPAVTQPLPRAPEARVPAVPGPSTVVLVAFAVAVAAIVFVPAAWLGNGDFDSWATGVQAVGTVLAFAIAAYLFAIQHRWTAVALQQAADQIDIAHSQLTVAREQLESTVDLTGQQIAVMREQVEAERRARRQVDVQPLVRWLLLQSDATLVAQDLVACAGYHRAMIEAEREPTTEEEIDASLLELLEPGLRGPTWPTKPTAFSAGWVGTLDDPVLRAAVERLGDDVLTSAYAAHVGLDERVASAVGAVGDHARLASELDSLAAEYPAVHERFAARVRDLDAGR